LESCKAVSANSNGTSERSPRAQRNAVQENSLNVTKQNGYGGGSSYGIQLNGLHSVTGNHKGNVLEEERASFAIKQASLENEIKQLKLQLSNKSKKETEIERRLEGMFEQSPIFSTFKQSVTNIKIYIALFT